MLCIKLEGISTWFSKLKYICPYIVAFESILVRNNLEVFDGCFCDSISKIIVITACLLIPPRWIIHKTKEFWPISNVIDFVYHWFLFAFRLPYPLLSIWVIYFRHYYINFPHFTNLAMYISVLYSHVFIPYILQFYLVFLLWVFSVIIQMIANAFRSP